MRTLENIFNDEWCDLLFNGKNQRYGAYEIRITDGKRNLIAIFVTLSLVITAILVSGLNKKEVLIKIPEILNKRPVELSEINVHVEPVINKPQQTIKPVQPKPPQIKFTAMVITTNEDVSELTSVPTIDSLSDPSLAIGTYTDLNGDPNAVAAHPEEIVETVSQPDNSIIEIAQVMPQFPGGNDALFKYLKRHLVYPSIASDNRVEGTVFIQFVINNLGQVTNVEVLRGFDESCENAALRVIRSMPNWLPGKQNGTAVNVRMTIPVKFRIE
jgi:periplasmic protein TonB